jgi:hypothetical protein
MTETLVNEVRRPVRLNNRSCPYCGTELSAETSTDDHVIGRNFVPKGSLNNSWNLILKACGECNNLKSDLEDDISAITMQPDCFGRFPDVSVEQEALRKGRSRSRRTGRPVSASEERINIRSNFGPAVMTFTLVSPPQVDERRLATLAWSHVIACLYWISFDEEKRDGSRFDEAFVPLSSAPRSDWGNEVHLAFMRKVLTWEHRLLGQAAGGNFRVAIRRLTDVRCWSWALEWNQSMRIVGLLGEPAAIASVEQELPALAFQPVGNAPDGGRLSRRWEKALADEEDVMFAEFQD